MDLREVGNLQTGLTVGHAHKEFHLLLSTSFRPVFLAQGGRVQRLEEIELFLLTIILLLVYLITAQLLNQVFFFNYNDSF